MHKVTNLSFPLFLQRGNSEAFLNVYQSPEIPFEIKRIFTVTANEDVTRGRHAHKECAQLLVALSGRCDVVCDDGTEKKTITLDSSEKGMLIPPSIWAEQTYASGTVLMVITDMIYDESDYIRDYDEFLKYRGLA